MNRIPNTSRRAFLSAVAAPYVVSKHVFGANDRIRIGVIGVGNRSRLLIDQLPEEGQVVAVADCEFRRCQETAAKKQANWQMFQDYRKLLDLKEVDAVIVGTTDHGRVLPCIHACQAGKDVYAEKPLTVYIAEGRALVKAARKHKRVFQVGSQQRSMAMNQIASEFVRKGGLGKLRVVHGVNYSGPNRYTGLPEEPVPEGLNWDMWIGQTPMRPYNQKLHRGWMGWWDYSGGQMTNWGAHGLDQIQMALGTGDTGPVEWWPLEDGPKGSIGFRYAGGVTVRLDQPEGGPLMGGAIFVGEKGKVEIVRNNFTTDPPGMITNLPPPEEVRKWRDEVALWQARYHMGNWLECIRTRQTPLADVEIGHRSISISHLANITRDLNRKLRWDPQKERFIGDREADRLVSRPRRKGYELPKV
ncbi:MAG: Gfo/Idh/MocA family oxidoreductase [Bryobacterales bacterium]|nr:Gfo/Idh/MocA family oxidoreductase [Bryobacterales bacterium]